MSFEETMRQILREELERYTERLYMQQHRDGPPAIAAGEDRLLALREAHRLFGYSPETLKKWMRKGVLARHGRGRSCRVSERELRAFLAPGASGTIKPAPPTDAAIIEMARKRARRGA